MNSMSAPLSLIIFTDVHYLAENLYDEGEAFQKIIDTNVGKYTEGSQVIMREMTEAFEVKEHEYTDEELQIFADLNHMVSTLESQNSLAPYDGEVIFLNAHLNATEKMMYEKLDALHKNAPQAEIHDFVDYSHGAIFVKEEMHSFYREVAQKLLGKGVGFGS